MIPRKTSPDAKYVPPMLLPSLMLWELLRSLSFTETWFCFPCQEMRQNKNRNAYAP